MKWHRKHLGFSTLHGELNLNFQTKLKITRFDSNDRTFFASISREISRLYIIYYIAISEKPWMTDNLLIKKPYIFQEPCNVNLSCGQRNSKMLPYQRPSMNVLIYYLINIEGKWGFVEGLIEMYRLNNLEHYFPVIKKSFYDLEE